MVAPVSVYNLINSLGQEIGSVTEWNLKAVPTLVMSEVVLTGRLMLAIYYMAEASHLEW